MNVNGDNRQGILAVGNLLIDKVKTISDYPKESMLSHIHSTDMSCGGGCLNILFDLAKMTTDFPLSVAGVLGNDQDGNYIQLQCRDRSVAIENVQVTSEYATSFTDVLINQKSGNRTFFHCSGASIALDVDFIAGIKSEAKIAHLAYLLVLPQLDRSDPEYGSLGAKSLSILQQKGLKTSLDLVSDSDTTRFEKWVKPALKYVDYLIINDEEAYALTGTYRQSSDDESVYQVLAEKLLQMGVNDTVIIHYPSGATGVQLGCDAISVPAYSVRTENIISSLGAGDAFCAGALFGLHEEYSLSYCMQLGCASARYNLFAVSATDAAPTYNELSTFIELTSI